MNSRAAAVAALEGRIGYVFTDRALLERALTHASVASRKARAGNNETLEFLGDRVLGLLAAEALVKANPDWREGELTHRLVALVSGESCARVARSLGLGPALRLDPGASSAGGRDNDRILGDALEALLAAIYLDGGLGQARAVFSSAWRSALGEAVTEPVRDAKTMLQEWAMARRLPLPAYAEIARSGPQHSPVFTVSVTVEGVAPAVGEGPSLRSAQTAAARALLRREGGAP